MTNIIPNSGDLLQQNIEFLKTNSSFLVLKNWYTENSLETYEYTCADLVRITGASSELVKSLSTANLLGKYDLRRKSIKVYSNWAIFIIFLHKQIYEIKAQTSAKNDNRLIREIIFELSNSIMTIQSDEEFKSNLENFFQITHGFNSIYEWFVENRLSIELYNVKQIASEAGVNIEKVIGLCNSGILKPTILDRGNGVTDDIFSVDAIYLTKIYEHMLSILGENETKYLKHLSKPILNKFIRTGVIFAKNGRVLSDEQFRNLVLETADSLIQET